MSELQTTSNSLVNIVEGAGALDHGTWVDSNGRRLKDTEEWMKFYVESKRFPAGDATDLIEYIEEKGLLNELQSWLSGPFPSVKGGDNAN